MLILTRRIGESVYIGDEVRMTVLGVRGTQVRIGINAPKDIPVHREEIYYKIKQEKLGGAPRPPASPGYGGGDDMRGAYRPTEGAYRNTPRAEFADHGHHRPDGRRGYDEDNAGNYAPPESQADDDISPEDPDPNNA